MNPVALAAIALSGCKYEKDIPSYATWLAQDYCGAWYAYEHKPELDAKSDAQWGLRNAGVVRKIGVGSKPTDFTTMIFKL